MNNKNNEYLNEGIKDVALAAEQEEIKSRKFKYGNLATIFTLIFIIAVILINIFIGYMTDRFVLEIDMTKERLFEISEDTKEVISDLDEQITITVLAEETTYRDSTELLGNIYETLQRYETLGGGKIAVRYINPNLNPKVVEEYNVLGNIASNDIIIESDKRFKKLSPTNLYTAETDEETGTEYYVGLRAEQRLTSALLFVTSEEIAQAAYIRGHNEQYSIDELDTLLNYANYEVSNIILAQEEIPEEVTLLMIIAPTRDFTQEEIAKLDAYFARGGDAIVAMTPNKTDKLEKLSLLFQEWGVEYNDEVIFDNSHSTIMPYYVFVNCKTYESITSNLNLKNNFVLVPGSLGIELTGTQTGSDTVTVLMESHETSFSKNNEEMVAGYDQTEEDAVGPFNMTVLSERLVADKNLNYTRSSVLFTSAGMISESILEESAFMNRDYIGATLNYISEYTEGIVIPDKDFVSKTLTIQKYQSRIVLWVIVLGIPLLIIALSIVIWARRRHL
jgi:hypothetical protein